MGGRLSLFADQWKKLTDNKGILDIIENGYKPEFTSDPPLTLVPWQRFNQSNPRVIAAVDALIAKNAIREVNPGLDGPGFYSHLFLVPKKSGGFRPILNLTALNRYVVKRTFRMETSRTILAAVDPGDWMVSIDLKDAYFHIAIHQNFQRYFRFTANGKQYQYTALPFGLASAPRVFTQVVLIPVAALHCRAVKLHPYLDDWLIRAVCKEVAFQHLRATWTLVLRLGFIPNPEKSSLTPCQDLVFVGLRLLTREGVALPTSARIDRLITMAHATHIQHVVSAKSLLSLLGLMVSVMSIVP